MKDTKEELVRLGWQPLRPDKPGLYVYAQYHARQRVAEPVEDVSKLIEELERAVSQELQK